MNTALWAVQSICAVIFLFAGLPKILFHKDKLKEMEIVDLDNISNGSVTFIGFSEVLGAIGLILPLMLGFLPRLTSISAIGLGIIMILASVIHFRQNDYKNIFMTLTILFFCITIAYFRW